MCNAAPGSKLPSRSTHPIVSAILGLLGFLMIMWGQTAQANDPIFFRIGTGGEAGTYYPIGTAIAQGIVTGTEGDHNREGISVIAVAQLSNGSRANVEAIRDGVVEAALAQANISFWAHNGSGPFSGQPPISSLRAIGNLYREALHIAVRRELGATHIDDLRESRVSLDEPGSGTLIDARIILDEAGLEIDDIDAVYLKPDHSANRMRQGELDAFFIVAGAPVSSITALADANVASVLSLPIDVIEALEDDYPYYSPITLPSNTYAATPQVDTIGIGALLVTSSSVDDRVIYAITARLWSDRMSNALMASHPRGKEIRLTNALDGIPIPLHPGAERFYRDIGMIR